MEDIWARAVKAGVVSTCPGYHARNFRSNLYQIWLAGLLKKPEVQIPLHKPGVQERVQSSGVQQEDKGVIDLADLKVDEVEGDQELDDKGRIQNASENGQD